MGPVVLEAVNLGVGVVMSLAGSAAVAPRALPQLGKIVQRDLDKVRGFFARFLPFLHRTAVVELHSGSAALSGVGTSRASGWAVLAAGELTLEERIDVLERKANQLHTQLQGLEARLDATAAEVRQAIAKVKADAMQTYAELKARLDLAEKQQTEINARAFPLVGFGIVISGLAEPMAEHLPAWLDLAFVFLSAAFAARVIYPIAKPGWSKWQADRRERGIPTWRQQAATLLGAVERTPVPTAQWALMSRSIR
jgi:outer membrane murein-binding lipoprotein Lpp